MATQYKDGSFSETEPLAKAIETFNNALEAGIAKAFYVGSDTEIKEVKSAKCLEAEINKLKDRLDKIEGDKNSIIIIPGKKDINLILGTK